MKRTKIFRNIFKMIENSSALNNIPEKVKIKILQTNIRKGESWNFEQPNFRMANISNLKINERSNVELCLFLEFR